MGVRIRGERQGRTFKEHISRYIKVPLIDMYRRQITQITIILLTRGPSFGFVHCHGFLVHGLGFIEFALFVQLKTCLNNLISLPAISFLVHFLLISADAGTHIPAGSTEALTG